MGQRNIDMQRIHHRIDLGKARNQGRDVAAERRLQIVDDRIDIIGKDTRLRRLRIERQRLIPAVDDPDIAIVPRRIPVAVYRGVRVEREIGIEILAGADDSAVERAREWRLGHNRLSDQGVGGLKLRIGRIAEDIFDSIGRLCRRHCRPDMAEQVRPGRLVGHLFVSLQGRNLDHHRVDHPERSHRDDDRVQPVLGAQAVHHPRPRDHLYARIFGVQLARARHGLFAFDPPLLAAGTDEMDRAHPIDQQSLVELRAVRGGRQRPGQRCARIAARGAELQTRRLHIEQRFQGVHSNAGFHVEVMRVGVRGERQGRLSRQEIGKRQHGFQRTRVDDRNWLRLRPGKQALQRRYMLSGAADDPHVILVIADQAGVAALQRGDRVLPVRRKPLGHRQEARHFVRAIVVRAVGRDQSRQRRVGERPASPDRPHRLPCGLDRLNGLDNFVHAGRKEGRAGDIGVGFGPVLPPAIDRARHTSHGRLHEK